MSTNIRAFNLRNILCMVVSVLIALGVGFLASFLSGDSAQVYSALTLPSFAPPAVVFPIVWTIIYIFMGINAYKVFKKGLYSDRVRNAMFIYIVQLVINGIWPIVFFRFNEFGLSVGVIIVLLALIIVMSVKFYQIDRSTLWLNLPYLLWVIFATALNIAIFMMN